MWTVRYILDLVFCFSYTDYKLICYLLLMLITLHNSTVNINTYQNAYLPTLTKDLEFIHIWVICLAKTNINYDNTSKWLLPISIFYCVIVNLSEKYSIIAVIYLFTRNRSTSCEISSNLVATVLAFLFCCYLLKPVPFHVLVFLVEYELVKVDCIARNSTP